MAQRMRIWLMVGILVIAGMAWAGSTTGLFSDELSADLYDCTATLNPAATLSDKSSVTFTLEAGDGKDALRVAVTRQTIKVDVVADGHATHFDPAPSQVNPGTPYHLTILRRGNWLGLLHDQTFLFRGEVPRPTGSQAGFVAETGWSMEEPEVQRLEPVRFADDFMRTADEPGNWVTQRGQWGLQSAWDNDPKGNSSRFANVSYSQNPFAWAGRNPDGSALCTTGKAFWEDYTMSVAMQAGAGSAAGLMVNMPDTTSGYLVRWSPANDHGAQGDRLALLKVADGKTTLVAEDKGGYIPGQWYKLTVVSSFDGLQVLVDNRLRLTAKDVTPWRGGVGLYAEGKNGAVYDDVIVNGRRVKTDIIAESQMMRINQRFQDDHNGMQKWSTRNNDWTSFPGSPSQLLNRAEYLGDHWMTLTVRPFNSKTGELWMVLDGDGKDPAAGLRAVIRLADGKLTYTLFRDTTQLATKSTKPLATNADYSFRFRLTGDTITLEQDGNKVLTADGVKAVVGKRPSYRAEGCFALARDVIVLGRNILNYSFSDAPVDWLGEGVWAQAMRWACDPRWSFLAGWSRGNAVLWHKQRFTGDQSLDVFLGIKMEYPRERDIYDNRYRDLAVTICGDGHNPLTGYTGIYLASNGQSSDPNERPVRRFVLLRNGVELNSQDVPNPPTKDTSHRDWFELTLYKRGATVEFWVENARIFSFTDPKPIDSGVPAIWTRDNGITVAIAQLRYANPPQPRTDAQVIIDTPWYPEWGNVGNAIKLNFPETWSTTGKPVQLKVTPRAVPAGEEKQVTVDEHRLTFTPKEPGDHWYQVTASDGENTSPAMHLALPVFRPSLGRDDSHALLLYRFDEGKGVLVHDQSKVTPKVDLKVTDTSVQWLPGQGLTQRGPSPLMSIASASKLLTIRKTNACTLEFWISPDTIYPANQGWNGCLLSWEDGNRRNLMVGHSSGTFFCAPNPNALAGNREAGIAGLGYRLGLQHYVITWNGNTTCWYVNGKLQQEKQVTWDTGVWSDATLFLGNQFDPQHSFLGTYYLVAIHDKCLNATEVQRHYNAGPSAR